MPKDRTARGQMGHLDAAERSMGPMMCKEGKGVRNFACLNYDTCLDKAAKAMWGGFTCRDCCVYIPRDEDPSC